MSFRFRCKGVVRKTVSHEVYNDFAKYLSKCGCTAADEPPAGNSRYRLMGDGLPADEQLTGKVKAPCYAARSLIYSLPPPPLAGEAIWQWAGGYVVGLMRFQHFQCF